MLGSPSRYGPLGGVRSCNSAPTETFLVYYIVIEMYIEII
jgi:hypothetical protein